MTPSSAVIRHHPRRHAAVRTDEYLYSQLIPYLGNKRKLLPLIAEALVYTGLNHGTFVDLFTGSTVVARLAKTLGHRVIANDWEPYSATIARATISLNAPPPFIRLGGVDAAFRAINNVDPRDGYIATHLCPRDDDRPDPSRERMFFTRANGRQIDAARGLIDGWESTEKITPEERAYLLSALLYAVSYVSNTSGVFKGFHHGWGGKTRTALYRILSPLTLRPPATHNNGQDNRAEQLEATALIGNLKTDPAHTAVYLDPPYNQHPYGSNYHVLNTIVLNDAPPVSPTITAAAGGRERHRARDKSAIRTDWRTQRRSAFNHAATAPVALAHLIEAIDARWIMLSYSTDGNIPLREVLRPLAQRGKLRVFTRKYKRYRVSSPRMSSKSHNVEFVVVTDTAARPRPRSVEELAGQIESEERRFWRG